MGEWSHWGYCVTALALAGCQQTLRLGPAELRDVVQQYEHKRRVELQSGSKRFAITPAQEPQLRLVTDTCRSVSDSDSCDEPQAPLADVRIATDDTLLLPHAPPVRLSEVTYADVVVEGRAAGPLDRTGHERRPVVYVGVQIGGSGYAQLSGRYVISRYLQAELGGMAIFPELAANASAGLLGELPTNSGFTPYLGAGVGGALLAGPGTQKPCGKPIDECPYVDSSESAQFWYARAGLAKYFLTTYPTHRMGLDVGFWRGVHREGPPNRSSSFLWPMAGISYHLGFGR